MLDPYPFRLFPNPRAGVPGTVILPAAGFRRARAEITAWPDYAPTPLRDLPAIAAQAGVAAVRLKDEAGRFGQGSFKALGGGYAVAQLLCAELARSGVAPAATSADLLAGRYAAATQALTVTAASEGNHGRAVAWAARRFGCACVIFIPHNVSPARAEAIARHGAEARRVAGTYDDAVREATRLAAAEGWLLVPDTSWPGSPNGVVDVMQGYRLMADEAADQWQGEPPTHVFVQGGVGGAAAAVSVHLRARIVPPPALIVVEPDRAACLLASAELGTPTAVPGDLDTIMAGLACGEPSLLAWAELERAACAFMAVPDEAAIACMKLLAGAGIVSGESGVAGLAGFLLAAGDPAARETLGLRADSRVLLFSTEGATDPELYRRLVEEAGQAAGAAASRSRPPTVRR
jgi:diaminopropionate ammonia-lyase